MPARDRARGFLRAAARLGARLGSVDLIGVLALGGALALREFLAGAIIALMLTGGKALERMAESRARRDLARLLERAPRVAHRIQGTSMEDIDVAEIRIGDLLAVKSGEIIPTDGVLVASSAVLDASALTGESRLAEIEAGDRLESGALNAGDALRMRAVTTSEGSTYAGIVRLVRAAAASKAPLIRLADRYAGAFLVFTLVAAAVAWMVSGDPQRALAVLVVATPCPLILAAPAAIISGVSLAARRGIIIKGGGPLEALARAKIVLFDKTGTVTTGQPRIAAVETLGAKDADDVVRVAAALEQLSTHPFAPAILHEARMHGLSPPFPDGVREEPGRGIAGQIEGRRVALGQLAWLQPSALHREETRRIVLRTEIEGTSPVFVSAEGILLGALILEDPLRVDAPRAIALLRKEGIVRIDLLTGDHADVADLIGDALGVDRVLSERTAKEKADAVRQARLEGTTIVVGDGINDAPALALADVGIAMGARGAAQASEAADVVLTHDRLEGLLLAVRIAKRTRRIAGESIFAGMGLSLAAMIAALFGALTPVAGAILQEVIDVLVILNALRALHGGAGVAEDRRRAREGKAVELGASHRALLPRVEEIAVVAGRLETLAPQDALTEVLRLRNFLVRELLPHEREEQSSAYPLVAEAHAGEDPTGPLIHTHHQIARLVRLYDRLAAQLPPEGPRPEELRDLRRLLYGIHAILALHFAQEDEAYLALATA